MANQTFPTAATPAVALQNGNYYFTTPWIVWLQQLASQPAAPFTVTPTASPFSYLASGAGTLQITGGTVSARTLTRGGVTVSVSGSVPVVNNDVVTVTYSVAPTLSFIPG
jgi:hypothetical protein